MKRIGVGSRLAVGLFVLGAVTSLEAAEPPPAPTVSASATYAASFSQVLAAGVGRANGDAPESAHATCLTAFDALVSAGEGAAPFLMERSESDAIAERLLAIWLLGYHAKPGGAVEKGVVDIVTSLWRVPMEACVADLKKKASKGKKRTRTPQDICENRVGGGRPPLVVRLGCETLFRMGSTRGADAIAASGAYGYFLRGCMPLFIEYGETSAAVHRALQREQSLRPNGGQIGQLLAEKGVDVLPIATGMLVAEAADVPPGEDDGPRYDLCSGASLIEEALKKSGGTASKAALESTRMTLEQLARGLPKMKPRRTQKLDPEAEEALLPPRHELASCVANALEAVTKARPRAPDRDASNALAGPSKHGPFCPK